MDPDGSGRDGSHTWPCTLPDWHIFSPRLASKRDEFAGPAACHMPLTCLMQTTREQHCISTILLRVRHDFNFKHGYLKQSNEKPHIYRCGFLMEQLVRWCPLMSIAISMAAICRHLIAWSTATKTRTKAQDISGSCVVQHIWSFINAKSCTHHGLELARPKLTHKASKS